MLAVASRGRERTTGSTDGERKQFTGHERDTANLDYMYAAPSPVRPAWKRLRNRHAPALQSAIGVVVRSWKRRAGRHLIRTGFFTPSWGGSARAGGCTTLRPRSFAQRRRDAWRICDVVRDAASAAAGLPGASDGMLILTCT